MSFSCGTQLAVESLDVKDIMALGSRLSFVQQNSA